MPGKEEKSQYPSCNRAFALRMMNPNSYRQGQVSPLDREIQPVVKRPVARSVSSRSDDSPLSISSSADTSYQDMELYDIDENGMCNGKNHILSSSFDSAMRPKGEKLPLSPRKMNDEFGMRRSLSSVDGFNQNSVMKRTHPARTTMPARIRSRGSHKDDNSSQSSKSKLSFANNQQSVNGKENPAQVKRFNTICGKSNSSSPILKDRKSRLDPSPDGRPRTPVSKVVKVAGTRSSELRAKIRSEGESKNDGRANNESESRSSKTRSVNGHNHKGSSDDDINGNSSDCSIDTVLKLSSPVTHSIPPNSCSSPIHHELPPSDEFSTKLAEVCQLISEKHPGDFQILETLVTMQTAYEDRDKQVKKAIIGLHERINELEDKLRNSPNIPSLVLPLLKASNSFQKQLHNIFAAHKETLSKGYNQVIPPHNTNGMVNGYSRVNPFDEIYLEANSVAEHILSRQNSRRKSNDENRHESNEQGYSRQNSRRKSNDYDTKNELYNGHHDANGVAEQILSRQNSLRRSNEESPRNGTEHNLSRQNSMKKTNEECHKSNGHLNGHINGGQVNGVNGCNGKEADEIESKYDNAERMV